MHHRRQTADDEKGIEQFQQPRVALTADGTVPTPHQVREMWLAQRPQELREGERSI